MTDYKAMYLLLFNAVTDALEKMDGRTMVRPARC